MPQISAGIPLVSQINFNSGYLDFGSQRIVNLDNIKIEPTVSIVELRQLNSIKMVAIKRKGFTVKLTAKFKSWDKEPFATFFGESSVDGSGQLLTFHDGQQNSLDPVFTAFIDDDVSKPFQCQLIGAVIESLPLTASVENYGEVDVTITAMDIKIFTQGI
jgi:hypothetical protein